MACADYRRHERLLECTHATHSGSIQIQVGLDDGCSGRLCPDCDARLGIKRWPDVAERIAGPGRGLDTLVMLRAMTRGT